MVHLIVAMTTSGIIGNNGTLPWYIPSDLKHFKSLTLNSSVIMGRKTFDSLMMPNGLPNRHNTVISRSNHEESSLYPILWVNNLIDAIKLTKLTYDTQDIFIIGGATVYKEAIEKNMVDIMHISFIKEEYDGDTKFPDFDKSQWDEIKHVDMGEFIYVQFKYIGESITPEAK